MKSEAIRALETTLDFCSERWAAADSAKPGAFPSADTLTGKKMGINEVIQFVRTQIVDLSAKQ